MDILIQLLMVFLGSMGFALVFHVRKEKILLASLGGLISWVVYLALAPCFTQSVPRYFIASMAAAIYAELLARRVKCPATTFLVTGTVPLMPGGSLYQAMSYFMARDYAAFSDQAFVTLLYAVSIAAGMLFPMSVFQLMRRARRMNTGKKTA